MLIVSAIMGFLFIIAFLFSIQDFEATVGSATGFPVMQIIYDCVGHAGAIVLMVMLIIACWQCGFASVAANSRMIYAFSRDNAMPGSKYWHKIDLKRQVCNHANRNERVRICSIDTQFVIGTI